MDIFEEFRSNLKFYRDKLQFSQCELAIQADCSNGLIGNIEAGKVKPSFDTIIRLATALKIHPADLFLRESSKSNLQIADELKSKLCKMVDETILN